MVLNTFNALGFQFELQLDGGRTSSASSGPTAAMTQSSHESLDTPQPLNLHELIGYRIESLKDDWSRHLGARREATKQLLTLDFLFTFVYGGALAVSLWWIWATVGRLFHPGWIIAPLAMILAADWTDHLIRVARLRQDVRAHEGRIQSLWIQASNCATIIELWLTSGLYVSLGGLLVRMIFALSHRRLAPYVSE